MSRIVTAERLTVSAFEPFGEVLDFSGPHDKLINQGKCRRHHDRARLDFSDGRAGISLFEADPRDLPYRLDMMERHPDGSQAFLPMTEHPFLVVVALDNADRPAQPRAFLTESHQGVNFARGTWHGVLTPLQAPGLFAVVDRIGPGPNLEEHWFDDPYTIVKGEK